MPISVEPTVATAGTGTINAADGKLYTFAVPMSGLIISVIEGAAASIYVKLNGTTCNATSGDWTFEVLAGSAFSYKSDQHTVTQVCVYSTAALTYGTDFNISGQPYFE